MFNFHFFPGVDFTKINLDWIMRKLGLLEAAIKAAQEAVEALNDKFPVAVKNGGTGATNYDDARHNLHVHGPFILTNNVLREFSGPGIDFTPSVDCAVVCSMGAAGSNAASVMVDGVTVLGSTVQTSAAVTYPVINTIFVQAGQRVQTRDVSGQAYILRFYGLREE